MTTAVCDCICGGCGEPFTPTNTLQTTCSVRCRVRVHRRSRERHAAMARRGQAARALIRAGEVDPLLALSLVVDPPPRLERAA